VTELVVVVDDLCERGKCIECDTPERLKVEGALPFEEGKDSDCTSKFRIFCTFYPTGSCKSDLTAPKNLGYIFYIQSGRANRKDI